MTDLDRWKIEQDARDRDASPTRGCPRTLALFLPGEALPGVPHHFTYTGRVPCTGALRCITCGETA